MKFNVHGGHSLVCRGASGFFDEVNEDRKVRDSLCATLLTQDNTVYDCTDDVGKTQIENLKNIVAKCNSHVVDCDISLHFNAANGAGNGTEVLIASESSREAAERIVNNLAALGFKNRGVKKTSSLYVLNHTKSKALLVEICFCDNAVDYEIYKRVGIQAIANAIAAGLTNSPIQTHNIAYNAHIENVGWQGDKYDGETAGTVGQGLRLEGIQIKPLDGSVVRWAKAHVENKGWVEYHSPSADTVIGSAGEGLRLEDLTIKLDDYKFRVHLQESGWTNWTLCDGVATLGTTGQGLRIEAIEIVKV